MQHLLQPTLAIVERAAAFIRGEQGRVTAGQVEEKFLNGLVSYVDRTAEEMLVDGLHDLLPDATFLTEEETAPNAESNLQWIIDPLDGTTNFLFGLPHYAISIGLKADRVPVFGLICHVPRDEYYYAWQGGGAWCDGRQIWVSERARLSDSLIATGLPYYDFGRASAYYAALQEFSRQTRGIRRFGAAALDLAYVASGQYDAFFEYGLAPWDVAAGIVLVQEAGGKICDFSGGGHYLHGREIIATNGRLYEDVLGVLRPHFTES
jgi:myo-inositol-1(or 4)-monophosphatase